MKVAKVSVRVIRYIHNAFSINTNYVKGNKIYIGLMVYRVSQKLRSLLRDLIQEVILSQKRHIHMGPIRNSSRVMSF